MFEEVVIMTNFEDLPLILNAKIVKEILGISKASVYNLFRSEDFPSFCIGKRMLIAKDAFILWLQKQDNKIKV